MSGLVNMRNEKWYAICVDLVNVCAASTLCVLFLVSDVFGAGKVLKPASVSVKQSGKNSVEAKNIALVRAARLSFEKMLKEYYSLEKKSASGISDKQISECISDYSMENEKQSDSYYIAKLSYRFSKEAVDDVLANRGLLSANRYRAALREITIIVSMHDFMKNIEHFKNIKHKICRFSREIVVMKLAAKYLSSIKANGVVYAVK
ncbi:hypothetical protein FACS1894122_08230 [Alphaproteobacteria bacterium]|nr:hypothetical protein FACS1894122_08230 [Alphaproteobacteria bacterium]